MIKTIIVDDEPLSISNLKHVLEKVAPDIDIVAISTNALESVSMIESIQPDLLFLDIEMPFLNGFQLYEKISGKRPLTVFVTAFDEFAIQAFKINAVDYVLKPLDMNVIEETIQRVRSRLKSEKNNEIEQVILSTIQKAKNKLSIHTNDGIKFINFDDVIYLSSDNSYTIFKLSNQDKKIISSKRLGYYEPNLPQNFIRIHHQHIVNTEYVDSYQSGRSGKVILKSGEILDVSERKKNSFLDYFS